MRHPWRSLSLAFLFALLVTLALFAPHALAAPPQEDQVPLRATWLYARAGRRRNS